MSVQQNLSDLFTALKSSKKKERTLGLESVAILLQQERIIEYLKEGSDDLGHGISWDVLFTNVHSAVIVEVERGAITSKFLSTINSAINAVKSRARAKINTNTLVCAILAVFSSNNLCSVVGKIYLDLASGHLLQHPKYRAEMRCEHWSDLIAMCKQHYEDPYPGGSSQKFLELMRKAVNFGVHYSLPASTLLALLPFYKTILLSRLPPSASFEYNLLTLVNTTIQSLAADNRFQVVEFVENVFDAFSGMYKKGSDINSHIFYFFDIALQVHHPLGVGPDNNLAHACDWNLWKQQLSEMQKVCEMEAYDVSRSGEVSIYFTEFLKLLADISHVVALMKFASEDLPVVEDNPYTPSTAGQKRRSTEMMTQTQKRAKLIINRSIGGILSEMTPRDQWFWLSYLEILIERHPTDIEVDYHKVVQLICNMLCDIREPASLAPLSRCAVLLLDTSCHDFQLENQTSLKSSWLKAAESLIRSVAKDNITEHHLVLQALIRNNVLKDVGAIFSLYAHEKLEVSAGSLDTLSCLLTIGGVKEEKQRLLLLNWCLQDVIIPINTSTLILTLILKQPPLFTKVPVKKINSYSDVYSAVNFCQELDTEKSLDNLSYNNLELYGKVSLSFLEILNTRIQDVISKMNSQECHRVLIAVHYLETILRTLSVTWFIKTDFRNSLLDITRKMFSTLTSTALEMFKDKRLLLTKHISYLFGLDLQPNLQSAIRSPECINSHLIKESIVLFHKLKKRTGQEKCAFESPPTEDRPCQADNFENDVSMLFESGNDDYRNMFGREIFIKKQETTILDVVELLCHFVKCSAPLNDLQNYVSSQLLSSVKDGTLKVTSPLLLPLIFRIVHMATNCAEPDVNTLNDHLEGLVLICQTKFAETSVLTVSLTILNCLIPAVGKYGNSESVEMFQKLMEGFRSVLEKRNYTIDVMVLEYLKALVKSLSFGNLADCVWSDGSARIFEDILNFLMHSSARVRLAAAKAVDAVFSFAPSSQSKSLTQLKSVLSQMLIMDDRYKSQAFASSSLIALAKAFKAANTIRHHVAYLIVKYCSTPNCTEELIQCFLIFFSKLMDVPNVSKYFTMHLKDLLTRWLKKENLLVDFPYQLLQFSKFTDFCKTHLSIIGAVCFITENIQLLKDIASKLGISIANIMEEAYPIVMPLALDGKVVSLSKLLSKEREEELQQLRLHEIGFSVLRESNSSTSLEASRCQNFFKFLVEKSSAVQQLLLLLEEDIVESVVDEDVTESFKKYIWFVQKYINEANDYNINCYVLRDVISVSLRILSDQYSCLRLDMCCDLLKFVIDAYINSLRSEIELLLPGISNTLVSVVIQYRHKASAAMALLRYLIIDKKDALQEAIARLDPFPDETEFKDLMNTEEVVGLREEMKRFVRVVGHKGRRVAGLTKLLHALENHKGELEEMYNLAQTKRSSLAKNLLNETIHQLVQLCSHRDNAVKLEAAKCLGELGAGDLSTTLLKKEESESDTYVPPELRLVDQTTALLGLLIRTESLTAKKAACKALYAIMRCDGAVSQLSNFYSPFYTNASSELHLEPKSAFGPPRNVWMPLNNVSHDDWVSALVISLLDTLSDFRDVCKLLADVCRVHAGFANNMLPLVFEVVLFKGTRSLVADVSQNVNKLLTQHIKGDATVSLKSISLLVESIDHVRKWTWRSGNHNFRSVLNVDLLLVAESAELCAAHFTSIFYSEAWFEEQKTIAYDETPSLLGWSIDQVSEGGDTLSRVIRSAYANVAVLDGLMGCGSSHLADRQQRLAHLEQLGRWQLVLPLHDAGGNTQGVATALRNLHLINTLSHVPIDTESQIACALKLGDWNCILPHDTPSSFQLHHYNSLKAFHDNDKASVLLELSIASNNVINTINDNQIESSRELYQSLAHLQCLKQLWDVVELKSKSDISILQKKWFHQDRIKPNDFSLMEEVLAARCVILKELCGEKDSEMVNVLGEQYLRLCKLSRKAKRDDINIRSVINLCQMEGIGEDLILEGKIEEARYFWRKNEHRIGTYLLSQLLIQLADSSKPELKAKCLRLYGNWMVDTKADNPKIIIEEYFLKSVQLAEGEGNKLESYAVIAKFADKNYVQRKEYLESSDFELRQNNIIQQNTLVNGLQTIVSLKQGDREKCRVLTTRRKESLIDETEVKNLMADAQYFLLIALRYYIHSLQGGDKYNHFMFRLISLWLNNMDVTEVSLLLNEHLPGVSSYKFITLLPQIVPRIHENDLLQRTVGRTLSDHPHHTLPFIFAIKNSHADNRFMKTEEPVKPTPRILAAKSMINEAAKSPQLATIICQTQVFTDALIHLANVNVEKARGVTVIPIPKEFPIAKINNLHAVLMPIFDLPVQSNLLYDNIVGIQKFGATFQMVGGVNAPKKLECLGTDGKTRVLLVKGRDDLRQDAVMQQVFGVINNLLSRNEETRRRKLGMRTYRVVPLSQRSGIIEWCTNTQPIGLYLVGLGASGGAHVKFRPNDIRPSEARAIMTNLAKEDAGKKLDGFLAICSKFRPVFHYFFLENFHSPGAFFEKRLAYIRSVATSSMIGYILGLGDRHLMNILIDNSTAEVIHIDFGIAFEEGKVLPTPETVPFRLTRDIVDGMGLSGVDGVFRASCEQTMEVLRENKEIIVTLLQVLLYDPLYSWTVSPAKALLLQNASSDNTDKTLSSADSEIKVNAMAERALLRVNSKLQGMEQDGTLTSVEGQVNGLIQQARDPSNLCRLFHGWQAYL